MKLVKKLGAITCIVLAMSLQTITIFAAEVQTITVAKNVDLKVSVDKIAEVEKEGTLSDITIEEKSVGDLTYSTDIDERTIALSLEDTDYIFNSLPTVTLNKGFEGLRKVEVEYLNKKGTDKNKIIIITLPRNIDQKQRGSLKISGLRIKADKEKITEGTLSMGIGLLSEEGYEDVKVAKCLNYGASLDIKKTYSLSAGDSTAVSFIIQEGKSDSLVSKRDLDLSLNKGAFRVDKDGNLMLKAIYVNGENVTSKAEINTHHVEDGKCKSISLKVPGIDNETRDRISIEGLEIVADLGQSGNIIVSVESRDLDAPLTGVIAEIEENTYVSVTKMTGTYGVKKQVGGAVVISEEEKRALEIGEIRLTFEGKDFIDYIKVPEIEVVEGNIKLGKAYWEEDDVLVLKVTKKSTIPSVIKISNFTYNVNNACPNGTFGVAVSGSSIAPESTGQGAVIKFDDFLTITDPVAPTPLTPVTPSPEPITPAPSTPVTPAVSRVTKFKIGSSTYEMNGVSYTMDAAAFSQGGRTMVPVLYVAQAAGISQSNINYANGVITIKGDKNVVLTLGSNIMVCDGQSSLMETMPAVVNGRTYVPVAEIARALGIDVKWDGVNQTAIFTK